MTWRQEAAAIIAEATRAQPDDTPCPIGSRLSTRRAPIGAAAAGRVRHGKRRGGTIWCGMGIGRGLRRRRSGNSQWLRDLPLFNTL